tara:strand:- start:181 stop:1680 length:1500 start_codon:yes stop_codon:yes gene_type:complete
MAGQFAAAIADRLANNVFGSPKLKAVGVNDDGQYVDAQGNPTQLFEQPSWLGRVLSSQAADIAKTNDLEDAARVEALKKQSDSLALANDLIGTQPQKNNPYLNAFGDRPNLASPARTPFSIADYASPSSNTYTNLIAGGEDPTLKALKTSNQLGEREKKAWAGSLVNPALRPSAIAPEITAQRSITLGTPTTVANAADIKAMADERAARYKAGQMDTTEETETLNNLTALAKAKNVDPNLLEAAINEAKIQAGLSKTKSDRLEDLQAGLGSDITRSMYASIFGGTPEQTASEPFINRVGPDGIQMRIRNPNYISPMQIAMAGLGGADGVPSSQGFNTSATPSFGYNIVNKNTGEPLTNFMSIANLHGKYAQPPAPPEPEVTTKTVRKPVTLPSGESAGVYSKLGDVVGNMGKGIAGIPELVNLTGENYGEPVARAGRNLITSLTGGIKESSPNTPTLLDLALKKQNIGHTLTADERRILNRYYQQISEQNKRAEAATAQ